MFSLCYLTKFVMIPALTDSNLYGNIFRYLNMTNMLSHMESEIYRTLACGNVQNTPSVVMSFTAKNTDELRNRETLN